MMLMSFQRVTCAPEQLKHGKLAPGRLWCATRFEMVSSLNVFDFKVFGKNVGEECRKC